MFGPVEHPWFDPLWRRIVLVAVCAGWTGVEIYFGNMTWVFIMGAIALYAAWAFLVAYKGSDDPTGKAPSGQDD